MLIVSDENTTGTIHAKWSLVLGLWSLETTHRPANIGQSQQRNDGVPHTAIPYAERMANPTKQPRVAIKSYKDLDVWKMSMDLVVASYKLARRLPKSEQFELASQIRRASVSVPANIAEGYGRRHLGDYVRHLYIANGSLKELETELILTGRLHYFTETVVAPVLELADTVERLLAGLTRSLRAISQDPRPKT